MADAVVKPEGKEYETTDKNMIIALMMQGFHLGNGLNSILPDGDNQMVYSFDIEAVWDTVEALLTGKPLTFTYADFWKADTIWQMNLRHYSRIRRTSGLRSNKG